MYNQHDIAYNESYEWFLNKEGEPLFRVKDISLGHIAQVYFYQKLIPALDQFTQSNVAAVVLKRKGLDWQLKFLAGLILRKKDFKLLSSKKTIVLLYDVRNKAIIDNMNAVATSLLAKGLPVVAVLCDPFMGKYVISNIPLICHGQFYKLSDEIAAHQIGKEIELILLKNREEILNRFKKILKRHKNNHYNDKYLFKFVQRFFRQTIRDVLSIYRLASVINPSVVVLGSDAHKLGRLFALMGPQNGWKSVVVQHGVPNLKYSYVPVYADYVAVWGNIFYKWFSKHGTENKKIIITGNPRYDRIIANKFKNKSFIKTKINKVILLTNGSEIFFSIINELAPALKSKNLPLIIKIHPSEQEGKYLIFAKRHKKEGVLFEIIKEKAVEDIVQPGDIAVTISSTAILEALLCGASVHILQAQEIPNSIPFEHYGVAKIATEPSELRRNVLNEISNQTSFNKSFAKLDNFFHDCLYSLDGLASKRVSDFVENLFMNI